MREDDASAPQHEPFSPELLALQSRLVRAASPWVRRPQDAEDAVQQAWLQMLERPPRKSGGVRSLLRLVTIRAAIKLNLRERNRYERELAVARSERQEEAARHAAESPGVLELLEQ